jgi:4-carboxymuconolactone decarboxylase
VWDRIAQSRGRVAGPFAALLHSPELARRIAETGHYVRFEGPLTQAERELAIITVARLLDAQYEWVAHAVLARKAGVRDEVIAAVRERRAPAGLTPAEAQVHGYAVALLRDTASATRPSPPCRRASASRGSLTSLPPSALTP